MKRDVENQEGDSPTGFVFLLIPIKFLERVYSCTFTQIVARLSSWINPGNAN